MTVGVTFLLQNKSEARSVYIPGASINLFISITLKSNKLYNVFFRVHLADEWKTISHKTREPREDAAEMEYNSDIFPPEYKQK